MTKGVVPFRGLNLQVSADREKLPPLFSRGVDIDGEIRKIRNRLRRYNASSVAAQGLRVLHHNFPSPLEKVRAAPWLTLLLVKWALQDRMTQLYVGPSISDVAFDELRQALWDLQGRASTSQNSPNVFSMLRTLSHVQVQFQRNISWGFLRWPALVARLAPEHPTRLQFHDTFSMSPESFIDLSFATFGAVVGHDGPIPPTYFEPLKLAYGANVDSFLSLFVRDLPGLRAELQQHAARRFQGKVELFEFPYLQRFPFLSEASGVVHCWHPLVFARGMEDAVHLRLSELGQAYTDPFSKVFEGYVVELLADASLTFFSEQDIWAQAGKNSSAVEAIVECADCNVFVESKMSLFWDPVVIGDDPTEVFNKTNHVRKAIQQGWQASDLVRSGRVRLGACALKPEDFLLVVTSRQLNIAGGSMLQRLYPENSFDAVLPPAKRVWLPPQNIFVISVEDFERLSGCIRAGEVDLGALLKDAARANGSPQTSRMYFSDFLGEHVMDRWTNSPLIEQARTDSEARLVHVLGQSTLLPETTRIDAAMGADERHRASFVHSELPSDCISPNVFTTEGAEQFPGFGGTGFFAMRGAEVFYITARHCLTKSPDVDVAKLAARLHIPYVLGGLTRDTSDYVPFKDVLSLKHESDDIAGRFVDVLVLTIERSEAGGKYEGLQRRAVLLPHTGEWLDNFVEHPVAADAFEAGDRIRFEVMGYPAYGTASSVDYPEGAPAEIVTQPARFSGFLGKGTGPDRYVLNQVSWKSDLNGFSGSPVFVASRNNERMSFALAGMLVSGGGGKAQFIKISLITDALKAL